MVTSLSSQSQPRWLTQPCFCNEIMRQLLTRVSCAVYTKCAASSLGHLLLQLLCSQQLHTNATSRMQQLTQRHFAKALNSDCERASYLDTCLLVQRTLLQGLICPGCRMPECAACITPFCVFCSFTRTPPCRLHYSLCINTHWKVPLSLGACHVSLVCLPLGSSCSVWDCIQGLRFSGFRLQVLHPSEADGDNAMA